MLDVGLGLMAASMGWTGISHGWTRMNTDGDMAQKVQTEETHSASAFPGGMYNRNTFGMRESLIQRSR